MTVYDKTGKTIDDTYTDLTTAYMAGYHSRDDEVEQLRGLLRDWSAAWALGHGDTSGISPLHDIDRKTRAALAATTTAKERVRLGDSENGLTSRLEETDKELHDCRTKFAAEVRANEELRREVAYWKGHGRADLRRAFIAGFSVSKEGFNNECRIDDLAPRSIEPDQYDGESEALELLWRQWERTLPNIQSTPNDPSGQEEKA